MAPITKLAAILSLSYLVAANGTQFITGACTSDADCAEGCCGFNTGKCAGPVVAQERDGGCGFGSGTPNANAAVSLGFTQFATGAVAAAAATSAVSPPAASGSGAGTGAGTQFITGPCTSDADCAEGCCGFNTGKCAGPVVAQERDGGCGFGSGTPNANAAISLGFTQFATGAVAAAAATSPATATVAAAASTSSNGAGNGAGKQFITGPCDTDADCADGCCGFNTGLCAGPVIAQERDGGCGHGDAQPNDNAAQALKGQRLGKRGVYFWMSH